METHFEACANNAEVQFCLIPMVKGAPRANSVDTPSPKQKGKGKGSGNFFFRPTPYGFRQVVQHVSKHVAFGINCLIKSRKADTVVAAKVNWWRTYT